MNAKKPRVFVARLFHETNTFVGQPTGLDDFSCASGEAVMGRKGDGSPLGAFLDFACKKQWDLIPGVDFTASPSGPVEDEVVESFCHDLFSRLDSLEDSLDAFFLILHGAMVSRSLEDVEGEILQRLRRHSAVAGIPLFGVLDLHANHTQAMTQYADCLVAYRENPHTDAAETAIRAAELLEHCLLSGQRPFQYSRNLPVLWPAPGTGTSDLPMIELERMAREAESAHGSIWCVNVLAGFAHADIADAGVAFSVVGTDENLAREIVRDLENAAKRLREKGIPREWEIAAALEDAEKNQRFPVCLVESADNIGGGAPGDCTPVLRALMQKKPGPAMVVLNDPVAVMELDPFSPGDRVEVKAGGRGFSSDPGPVLLRGILKNRTNGRFDLEDAHSHLASMAGLHIDMGPSVVLECDLLTVLITSHKTPPFDLGQLRSQGIEPTGQHYLVVKAAVAYRRAYNDIAAAHYFLKTAGPCTSELSSLPFKKVRRPVFPLDS
jgi:microcystin degradation protein MlrC